MELSEQEREAAFEVLKKWYSELDDCGIYMLLGTAEIQRKQAYKYEIGKQYQEAAEAVRGIINRKKSNIVQFRGRNGK